ncbi:hypothetical protein KAR04_03520, partial [Candidatus Calescamantes bacterium]|nr:hypothetical protein [Candidatus Calescamantes bacterium]
LEYGTKIASAIVTVFMNHSTHYLRTSAGMRRFSRLEYGTKIASAIVKIFIIRALGEDKHNLLFFNI